jgi:hypothetical protein
VPAQPPVELSPAERPAERPAGELADTLIQSGQTGWIRAAEILPQVITAKPLPSQQQACL